MLYKYKNWVKYTKILNLSHFDSISFALKPARSSFDISFLVAKCSHEPRTSWVLIGLYLYELYGHVSYTIIKNNQFSSFKNEVSKMKFQNELST